MDKEKSAVESFLGELSGEQNFDSFAKNEDPFAKQETVEEKVEEKEEKPLPFNKDPKIQKFIEKEISRKLAEFEVKETPRETQPEDNSFKDTIDAFTAIIGNDTPEKVNALNALKNSLSSLDQRASQKAIEKLEEIRNQESQADKEAEEELNSAFESIEETFGVDITSKNPTAIKTRQEFVSFVEKIAPKDRNGDIVDYPDMQSAWETFSEIKKSTATPSRAKELASRSMSRSAETTTTPQKRIGWNEVDEFMDTLK